MKTRLAMFAVVVLAAVGLARADEAGPIDPARGPGSPKGAQKKANEAPARGQPTPEAGESQSKTDRERIVGNWFIINDDSQRRGEMWVITEDSILMHAKDGGAIAHHYAHRLDDSKEPKQIDITVSLIKGPTVGVIKGIYDLEGDELRLCLGEIGKDRPAAFPEKPKLGELLVLRRASSGAPPAATDDAVSQFQNRPQGGGQSPFPPKAPEKGTVPDGSAVKGAGQAAVKGALPPAVKDAEPPAANDDVPPGAQDGQSVLKLLTPEEASKRGPNEKVTVRFKVTAVLDNSQSPGTGFGVGFIQLKDGGNFSVRIVPPAMNTINRLDIEPAKHFTGKMVQVTGFVKTPLQSDTSKGPFWIEVNDLEQLGVFRE